MIARYGADAAQDVVLPAAGAVDYARAFSEVKGVSEHPRATLRLVAVGLAVKVTAFKLFVIWLGRC